MFSEWRKRSKFYYWVLPKSHSIDQMENYIVNERDAYDLARAAFKAGVRAGIKQEQARRKK